MSKDGDLLPIFLLPLRQLEKKEKRTLHIVWSLKNDFSSLSYHSIWFPWLPVTMEGTLGKLKAGYIFIF